MAAGNQLTVSLRLDGDSKPLQAEIVGAERSLDQLGETGQKAGRKAEAGLRAAGSAASATAPAAQGAAAALGKVNEQGRAAGKGLDEAGAGAKQAGDSFRGVGEEAGGAAPLLQPLGDNGQKAATGLRNLGASAGVTANQMRQLTPQLNDVFTSLVGGMPLYMIAAQQGPQITQVFGGTTATVRALTASASALMTPLSLTVGAALGLGAAVAAAAISKEREARQLIALSAQLRTTRDDYQALADTVMRSSRAAATASDGMLSRGTARDTAGVIAGSRRWYGDENELQRLVLLSQDLAVAYGVTAPQAAERFIVKAINDPAAAAREAAAGGLRTFDVGLQRTIERLTVQGRTAEASSMVLDAYAKAVSGVGREQTDLGRAWSGAGDALGDIWKQVEKLASPAATRALELLALVLRGGAATLALPGAAIDALAFRGPSQGGFEEDLIRAEGRAPGVMNAQGYVGSYQFGSARLSELGMYRPAAGESPNANSWQGTFSIPGFEQVRTLDDFRANAQAQRAAFAAHLADIDRAIDAAGLLESPRSIGGVTATRDGLRAVAHLGGVSGMRQFVESGGAYDPADANGTKLSDYFSAFSRSEAPPAAPTAPRPPSVWEGTVDRLRANTVDDAARAAASRTPFARQRQALEDELTRARNGLAAAEPGSESARILTADVAELERQLTALRDPIQNVVKGLEDQTRSAGLAEGPVRELAEANERLRQAEEEAGRQATPDERARAQDAVLRSLSGRYNLMAEDLGRQVAAQGRMREAYGQGAEAVREAELRERAMEEARRVAVEGTPRHAAVVEALTARYRDLAAATGNAATASAILDQNRQREVQSVELSLIGSSARDRATTLARLRARQELERNRRPTTGPEAQAYIDNAADNAVRELDLQRQQAAFDELGDFGSRALDRITASATTLALEGKNAFEDMGNVGKAVANELMGEFFKLAAVNPLKNALFGGNSTTLMDVLGRWMGGSAGGWTGNALTDFGGGTNLFGEAIVFGHHAGGRAGHEPTFLRSVPTSLFDAAPRFHNGRMPSLGAGEIPAIIRDDEGVFTPEQMRALGPAGGTENSFALSVNFHGTPGTAEDREAIAREMAAMVRTEIARATPGIIQQSGAYVLDQKRRGGAFGRELGA